MARIYEEKLKNVVKVLEKKKVFTLSQLVSALECSVPTGRLKLKQWRTYTSYNENGRYYTLPKIPCFNENGLWHYKEISFSQHGNLKKTVVHLITNSSSGLTGKQIGDLVRLPSRSFLHHFRDAPGIQREKRDGVYVYFSAGTDTYREQLQHRLRAITEPSKILSDAEALFILTALIKHHNISPEAIAELPEIKEREISLCAIREFMRRHDLLVKKTPPTDP